MRRGQKRGAQAGRGLALRGIPFPSLSTPASLSHLERLPEITPRASMASPLTTPAASPSHHTPQIRLVYNWKVSVRPTCYHPLTMIVYTGHTALEYWRWIARTATPSQRPPVARLERLPEITPRTSDAVLESAPFRESDTIELMIAGSNYKPKSMSRYTTQNFKYHARSCAFPPGALCRISKGILVTSPALLLVELANELDLIELIMLGCELASTYTPNRDDLRGFSTCQPLLRPAGLQRFINQLGTYNGSKRARVAAKHMIPDSASPMETKVALLLSLPKRLGGFGLPTPELNHEITVETERCVGYKRGAIRFDMFWKKGSLAVEYDSDQWHTGPEKIQADSMRRNAINALGYDVITITNQEYQNIDSMTDIARTIAKKVRHKMRPVDANEYSRRVQLMRVLSKNPCAHIEC